MGFIFQAHNLIPFLTARQNVLFPLNLVGLNGEAANRRVMELLEYMEIEDRGDYLPALLSGGEQQRVAIARALANNPSPSLPNVSFLINICSLKQISQSYLIDFINARCQNVIVVLDSLF